MPKESAIDKAYQSIYDALSGYNRNVGKSYRGGILELAQRLDTTIRTDNYGRQVDSADFLSMVRDGQGELANWKTDTRLQMVRDIEIVVSQFPELDLAADTALEAMCDSDTVNGTMKFTVESKIQSLDAAALIDKLETKYHIKYHLRRTVYKSTLTNGEYYVLVKRVSDILKYTADNRDTMTESVSLLESVGDKKSTAHPKNNQMMKAIYESAQQILGDSPDVDSHQAVDAILSNITVHSSFEQLMFDEFGPEGMDVIAKDHGFHMNPSSNMFESVVDGFSPYASNDNPDAKNEYDRFKGCYLKWMSATQVLPIRVGTVLLGYYYIHYSNANISNKSTFASGIVDISQTTTLASSRDFMQQITDLLAYNMDMRFVQKNVDLIEEMTTILMENQFRKRDVSFTYIPKEDIIPFKINMDVEENGTSMFARSIFNARLYSMLLMTNLITVLNNRPSRTYKVKKDFRTTNIASTIQSFKEKIYSKRIGVDDVWSYNGAMNKIGSPSDMVIPVDPDGTPPFTKEYDEGANIQVNNDFMDYVKKSAIALTGVPNAIINQQDEIEYSKLAQMSQLKLLDFVKSLKIDFNESTTQLYRKLIMCEFNVSEEDANAITVAIPDVKSNDINIIAEMLQTYSNIFEQLQSVLLTQDEALNPEGKPSNASKNLKYEIMKVMIPSIDYHQLEEIKGQVLMQASEDNLTDQASSFSDFSDDEDEPNLPQ